MRVKTPARDFPDRDMANALFSASHDAQRQRLAEVARALHQLATDTRQESLGSLISDLREAIKEPFLFVIAGEVKAGKSSFINALLGSAITAVAPDPCTDTVQQIVYGPEPETLVINPFLKKIYHPAEILRSISVVDTPGTNTIIAHHQEITERFIPRADLVVFVLEAKNPYRQSAWDFLDLIHADWQKKLIFVLQQADLMEPADLAVNIEGLRKQVGQRGIQAPVFAVSAKLEQAGQRAASGFQPLIDHIAGQITGRDAVRLKLQSSLATLRNLHGRFAPVLAAMAAQYETDRAFREEIGLSLREQEARSQRQASQLVRNLIGDYERHTLRTERELEDGLGFFTLARRAISSVFSKGDSPQAWLQDLTHRLELELTNSYSQRLQEGVEEIAESISQMARLIDLKVQQASTSLKPQSDVFGDITERRRLVLRDLQEGFQQFMHQTDQYVGREIFPEASRFSPNIAAGSSMAVIGAVLTAATQVTALDITGGVLSAAGLLFAGGTVAVKRGKIIKGFHREIEKGKEELSLTLEEKLQGYIQHIRSRIEGNFTEFDALLETETRHLTECQGQHQRLGRQLDGLAAELSA